MSNLKFIYLIECCAHETRPENLEYNLFTLAKVQFSHKPHGSIQDLCTINLSSLRRKS